MFEQGALVQVLGKGTMYAQRTQTLRNIYSQNSDLSEPLKKINTCRKDLVHQ